MPQKLIVSSSTLLKTLQNAIFEEDEMYSITVRENVMKFSGQEIPVESRMGGHYYLAGSSFNKLQRLLKGVSDQPIVLHLSDSSHFKVSEILA